MLRLDLIEKKVKELDLLQKRNKAENTEYIEKSLYYTNNAVTKSVPLNKGNLSAKELLGTQVVFPSDEAASDGSYLIFVSPRFSRGRTVYKLFNNKSGKEIKNTVKIKESSLPNYIYQVDPNTSPEESSLDGEETPEIENLDTAVQRNRETTTTPKTETETEEEYQDRFMKEYHDLVRDINGALQDVDPELLRKQWLAKKKAQALEQQRQEIAELYDSAIAGLLESANCLSENPQTKSLLNFKPVLKSVSSVCKGLIQQLIDKYQGGKHNSLAERLKVLEVKDKCELSDARALKIKEDLEFILENIQPTQKEGYKVEESAILKLKEDVAYAAMLHGLTGFINDEDLIEFYKSKSSFLQFINVGLTKDKDPSNVIAACLSFVVNRLPPYPNNSEKQILLAKAKELVSILGTLYDIRDQDNLLRALGITKKGKTIQRDPNTPKNIFAIVAGKFLGPMLGLIPKIDRRNANSFPFYLSKLSSEQESVDGDNLSTQEVEGILLAENPYEEILSSLSSIYNAIKTDISAPNTNPELQKIKEKVELLLTSSTRADDKTKLEKVLAAITKLNTLGRLDSKEGSASEENNRLAALEAIRKPLNALKTAFENARKEKSGIAKPKTQKTKPDLPSLVSGLETTLGDFSLKEIFEGIWILGTNGPREQMVLNHIANTVASNFGCPNTTSGDCKTLKDSVILFLSTDRNKAYSAGSVTTPKGEAFENFTFLQVLQDLIKSGTDVKSMRFNGEVGIKAFNEYLRCSSEKERRVLKDASEIDTNLQNAIDSAKANPNHTNLLKVLEKVKQIRETPRANFDENDLYQGALVAVSDLTKVFNPSEHEAFKNLFYERQNITDIANQTIPTAASKKRKTEKELKDFRETLVDEGIIPISTFRKMLNSKSSLQALGFPNGAQNQKPENKVDLNTFINGLSLDKAGTGFVYRGYGVNLSSKLNGAIADEELISLAVLTAEREEFEEDEESENPVLSIDPKVKQQFHDAVIEELKQRMADNKQIKTSAFYTLGQNLESLRTGQQPSVGIKSNTVTREEAILELAYILQDTTFDKPSTEEKSLIFYTNFITKSFAGKATKSTETTNCPSAVNKTTREVITNGVKTEIPIDEYNPEAFLRANYSSSDESGVIVLGLSKVNGIPGEQAGFGDVAFMRAKGFQITETGDVTLKKGATAAFSLDVFESKISVNKQDVNFNAFGRIVGAGNAALEMFRNHTSVDTELDMYVIKVEGIKGQMVYEDAQPKADKLGYMHQQIGFSDRDALIDRNVMHQTDVWLAQQIASKEPNRTEAEGIARKNALAAIYNGIPNQSNLEYNTVASFPGYVALIKNSQNNPLKDYLIGLVQGSPEVQGKSDAEIVYAQLENLWNSKTEEDFLRMLPAEIDLDRQPKSGTELKPSIRERIRNFLKERNRAESRVETSISRQQFKSGISSLIRDLSENVLLKHYKYTEPKDLSGIEILSKEEEDEVREILDKLDYDSPDDNQKRRISNFLRENNYVNPMLPQSVKAKLASLISGNGESALLSAINAHNSTDSVAAAFTYSYKEQADAIKDKAIPSYGAMLSNTNASSREAGKQFLKLYLAIVDDLFFQQRQSQYAAANQTV